MDPEILSLAYRAIGRYEVFASTRLEQKLQKEEIRATVHLTENPGKMRLIRQALNYLKKPHPFSISLFCQLHGIVKRDGPNKKDIGKIRNRQNWIGPEGCPKKDAYFFPPKAEDVKPALHELLCFLRKKGDPLLQLAIGFAEFLIIHPFMDGNGRVARLLIPYYLKKRGLPPLYLSAYFERTRIDYLRKLYYISERGDWAGWIEYFLKGIQEAADEARAGIKTQTPHRPRCR